MAEVIKKYLSLLALLVFLTPVCSETLHAFEHRDDIHCYEKARFHYHTAVHHCSLCDLSISVGDKPASAETLIIAGAFYMERRETAPAFYPHTSYTVRFLRGPPAIA